MKIPEGPYRLADTDRLDTPALVWYLPVIRENIRKTLETAGGPERLWPHIKTYKSEDMIRLLLSFGIRRFKCATVAEAEMCLAAGAEAVILAYPAVGPMQDRLIALQRAFPDRAVFAIGDDAATLRAQSSKAAAAGVTLQLLMDLNSGMTRTGVRPEDAEKLYTEISRYPGLRVAGFHVYDGHHHERDLAERKARVAEEMRGVYALREKLAERGLRQPLIVAGGTPTFPCHAADPENPWLSPGTCFLHDAGYASAFPDMPFQIGAMVLTRVISHPASDLFTTDLGNKAVAADPGVPRAVLCGYETCETVLQNEEHWVLRVPSGSGLVRPEIGTVLYAAPMHVCPTTILYPSALIAEEGRITGSWRITARDRKLTI